MEERGLSVAFLCHGEPANNTLWVFLNYYGLGLTFCSRAEVNSEVTQMFQGPENVTATEFYLPWMMLMLSRASKLNKHNYTSPSNASQSPPTAGTMIWRRGSVHLIGRISLIKNRLSKRTEIARCKSGTNTHPKDANEPSKFAPQGLAQESDSIREEREDGEECKTCRWHTECTSLERCPGLSYKPTNATVNLRIERIGT